MSVKEIQERGRQGGGEGEGGGGRGEFFSIAISEMQC